MFASVALDLRKTFARTGLSPLMTVRANLLPGTLWKSA